MDGVHPSRKVRIDVSEVWIDSREEFEQTHRFRPVHNLMAMHWTERQDQCFVYGIRTVLIFSVIFMEQAMLTVDLIWRKYGMA
jgi:hypothetical protein